MSRRPRLTIKGVLAESFRMMWELDTPFLRTVWWLLRRPHKLIRIYLRGKRHLFTNPVKLSLILGGLLAFLLFVLDPPEFHAVEQAAHKASSEQEAMALRAYAESQEVVLGLSHILAVLAVPAYAFMTWLMYQRLRWTLAEHLVFALFAFAGTHILTIPLMPIGYAGMMWLTGTTVIVSLVYMIIVGRLTFGGTTLGAIGKSTIAYFVFIVAYIIVQMAVVLAITAWKLLAPW